jgi:putative ABC transport system permease protein
MWRHAPLLFANLGRRRVRTILTIASVATAFLLYGLLEALRYAITGGVDLTGADRLIVTHKISIIQTLPRSYLARVRGIEGVRAVTASTWFGGVYQSDRNQVTAQVAEPETFFQVYPEVVVDPQQRQNWLAEPTGALVGESLARSWGWKVGDRIPLRSNIYRKLDGGDTWELKIAAIYRMRDDAGDTSGLFLPYQYFNESIRYGRDQAGWIVVRVRDPARSTEIARRIDSMFANSFTETKTSSERAFAQGFINQIGNVGAIISAIVSAVLFTMLLVTANTMAQSIRERTAELAVLKTLGYPGSLVLRLVLIESLLITFCGGALGIVLATFIARSARRALQQYLPLLQIPPHAYLYAFGCILLLGLLAGAMPAWQAWRLRITTALRRV